MENIAENRNPSNAPYQHDSLARRFPLWPVRYDSSAANNAQNTAVAKSFAAALFQSSNRVKLSLSHGFHNKTPLNSSYHAHHWQPIEISLEELIRHITSGKAWLPAFLSSDHRTSEHFIQAEILALDIDNAGLDIDDLLRFPFIRDYAFFIHRTPSWTPESPRCRVLFRADVITSIDDYKHYASKLLFEFGEIDIDKCSKVAVQPFYGSTQPNYYFNPDAYLPLAVLDTMPEPTRKTDPVKLHTSPAVETYDKQAYITQIETALDASYSTGGEWSDPIACPFHAHEHDDTRPRASWNRRGEFLHCLKCSTSYGYIKTGAALNITLRKVDFTKGLHTSTAETLLSIENGKHDTFTRVLWSLLLVGVEAGTILSERQIVDLLKPYQIGRKAIQTAVSTVIDTGEKLLAPFGHREEALLMSDVPKGSSRFSGTKIPRHNTKHFYRMPSESALCEALDIVPIGKDAITLADLKSTKTLRMALNRALVKRKQEIQASQKTLGKRLGVKPSAVSKYIKQDEQIESRQGKPKSKRITLANIDTVPAVSRGGYWLEIEGADGRYAAYRQNAIQFLQAGHTVYLMIQTANIYTFKDISVQAPAPEKHYCARCGQAIIEAHQGAICYGCGQPSQYLTEHEFEQKIRGIYEKAG